MKNMIKSIFINLNVMELPGPAPGYFRKYPIFDIVRTIYNCYELIINISHVYSNINFFGSILS